MARSPRSGSLSCSNPHRSIESPTAYLQDNDVLRFNDAQAAELLGRETPFATILDHDDVVPQAKLNGVGELGI